jgi:hypothetical protein
MAATLPVDKNAMKAVRSALAVLMETEPLIAMAEEAGFDVAEERARLEHYKGLSTSILAVYEPLLNKIKGSE